MRRKHLCVVENHHVAFVEEIENILEGAVVNLSIAGINYHEPAFVANRRRMLSYALVGQFKSEL